ncbi:MAG: acyl carrier protein [Elusimicrobiota bacterium]
MSKIKERNKLIKEIKEILAEIIDIHENEISMDSDLINDLGMDSINAVELSYELNERYGLDIAGQDFKDINRVEDIVENLNKILHKY